MAAPKGLKLTPEQRRAIAKAETDQAIRRLVKRERLAAGLNVKVLGQLKRLERDTVAKLTAYDPEDLSFRARRLRQLKREVGEEIKARYGAIQDEVHAELKGLAADEGAWKAKTIGESYASVGASLEPALAPKAVLEAMASRPVVLGATAAEFWGKQGQDLADRFGREMQIGVGAGEGLGKLTQRVRGTKANNYSDGVMALSRRHAETLVRTSTNSVANAAQEAVYAANADIIEGVMQQSVLDGRTSMVCMGRHGLKWKLDGTPIGGHGKPYRRPPLHFACRSVLISLPIGTNAEDDIPNTEFGEWFDGLDGDAQDDLFGPGRAKLWREGRIKQATLLDQRGRPMTLEALRGKASPEPPANTPLSSPPDGASLRTVKPIIDSNANSVKARIADVDETIQTSWGGNLQARAGKDYILEYGDDDFGVVRADIFEDTYIRARGEGRFRKNPDVTIQYWITDKPRKIRTLEGVVDASPGDHIMVGTRGEMWPVKAEKFAARYQPADVAQSPVAFAKIKVSSNLSNAQKGANGKALAQAIETYAEGGNKALGLAIEDYLGQPDIFGKAKLVELKGLFEAAKPKSTASKKTPAKKAAPAAKKKFSSVGEGLPPVPKFADKKAPKKNNQIVEAFFEEKIKNDKYKAYTTSQITALSNHIGKLVQAGAFYKKDAAKFTAAVEKLKLKAASSKPASSKSAAKGAKKPATKKKTRSEAYIDASIKEILAVEDLPPGLAELTPAKLRTMIEKNWKMSLSHADQFAKFLGGGKKATVLEKLAVRHYTGGDYQRINNQLRLPDPPAWAIAFRDMVSLALRRLDSPEAPEFLYRGVGKGRQSRWDQAMRSLKEGVIIENAGIGSYSSRFEFARNWASRRGGEINGKRVRGLVWRIEKPKSARDVKQLSLHPGEDEWIIPDGAKFRVKKVFIEDERGPNKDIAFVELEEIDVAPASAKVERALQGLVPTKVKGNGVVVGRRVRRGVRRNAKQDARDFVLDGMASKRHEHAAVVDGNGKTLWKGTSGKSNSVVIEGLDKIGPDDFAEIIHSHPGDASLSIPDLMLTRRNGRRNTWISAYTREGSRFKARALVDIDEDLEFAANYAATRSKILLKEALADVSPELADDFSWHLLMLALKRQKRIQYASALSQNSKDVVERLGPDRMDDIVSKVAKAIDDGLDDEF